jgi:hypothetical protein
MDGADALAAVAEYVNINSGISGPVTRRAVEILSHVTLKNQPALALTDWTGLVFTALTRSETRTANNNKRRCTSNHSATSIGSNSQKISEN